jgi:hypothetical protein
VAGTLQQKAVQAAAVQRATHVRTFIVQGKYFPVHPGQYNALPVDFYGDSLTVEQLFRLQRVYPFAHFCLLLKIFPPRKLLDSRCNKSFLEKLTEYFT